jgi:hypothetical protein
MDPPYLDPEHHPAKPLSLHGHALRLFLVGRKTPARKNKIKERTKL